MFPGEGFPYQHSRSKEEKGIPHQQPKAWFLPQLLGSHTEQTRCQVVPPRNIQQLKYIIDWFVLRIVFHTIAVWPKTVVTVNPSCIFDLCYWDCLMHMQNMLLFRCTDLMHVQPLWCFTLYTPYAYSTVMVFLHCTSLRHVQPLKTSFNLQP